MQWSGLTPPLSEPPTSSEYKFPIETYAGLDQVKTAERIAKLEAETKAMLTQRSGLARYSQDLHDLHTTGDMVSYNACMIW